MIFAEPRAHQRTRPPLRACCHNHHFCRHSHTPHPSYTTLPSKDPPKQPHNPLLFYNNTRWKDGSHWFRCSCLRHARRRQRARSHRPELRDECHRGEVSRAIDWGVIRALSVSGKRSAVVVDCWLPIDEEHQGLAWLQLRRSVSISRISRSHGNHHSNLPLPPCTHHPPPPVLSQLAGYR